MLMRIKSYFLNNKHSLSLIIILWLSAAFSLVFGSLLQHHWKFWTHRFHSFFLIVYLVFIILLLLATRYYAKHYNMSLPAAKPQGTIFPYSPQSIPKSDGKAFAKLFAYGTAINKGEGQLARFIIKFQLTSKEQDVMRLLICSDATIKELSHDLMVSERVCQRHLTSIYEKTETKSRLSLLMKFYE